MALSLESGPSHVTIGALATLSGASEMTIAMWLKLENYSADAAIAVRGTAFSPTSPWVIWRDEVGGFSGRVNTLSARLNTDVGSVRAEGADDLLADYGVWHHVAVVFEANQADGLRLFVDGQRDANDASTVGHAALETTTDGVTLGIDDASKQLVGEVAEFAAWDIAFTNQQIAHLANGFGPLSLTDLLPRCAVYHDLVRGVNRPGLGPAASVTGSYATVPHPRIQPAGYGLPLVDHARSLLAGPYATADGQLDTRGAAAGQPATGGAVAGSLIFNT